MGFRKDAFATVWKVDPKLPNVTTVNISTSRKNKQTGEYETDFSGFVSFCGSATAAKAAKLKERDRIKLGDVDVTTFYKKETKQTFTNYACFSFEFEEPRDQQSASSSPASVDTNPNVDDGEVLSDGELPF